MMNGLIHTSVSNGGAVSRRGSILDKELSVALQRPSVLDRGAARGILAPFHPQHRSVVEP